VGAVTDRRNDQRNATPNDQSTVPLARLLGMAFRQLIDDLHVRLADQGWHDVRQSYGFVLLAIRDQDTTTTELAALLGVTKQAMSKLLDMMEQSGYVHRRAAADGRMKAIALAPRGHELLAAVEAIYAELEAEWAAVIGGTALEQTRTRVDRVLRARHGGQLPQLRPA
jgi:DNA-binding MarR family transcriptional regulator